VARPASDGPRTLQQDGTTWIQPQVAAERLHITPGRIYHLIADGRLHSMHYRGLLYVDVRSVKRYATYQRQLQHLRTKMVPLG
jgi:hypothetical protein